MYTHSHIPNENLSTNGRTCVTILLDYSVNSSVELKVVSRVSQCTPVDLNSQEEMSRPSC